ncbi:DUF4190 domain-containing protein [Pueribacillus sp. YX66]|uniref:DUF4190 domain-containing protein n=1 Tax=Pueribacillus sp. YX66 TaxID=3229242 RepID=UPI00358D846B
MAFIELIAGVTRFILYPKSEKEIDNNQEKGKGMAIAGFICSIVGIALQTLAIIAFLAFMQFTNSIGVVN